MMRSAYALAYATLLLIGQAGSPAAACGYDGLYGNPLQAVYPGSISLAVATRTAVEQRLIPAIAPLKPLGKNLYVLELFHGPTLAFKDFALQLLGLLYKRQVRLSGKKLCVLGATSGDTGSAAIHGCMGQDGIQIFILYPNGRVSPLQERQMACTGADNVFAIPVPGTFDDAQRVVTPGESAELLVARDQRVLTLRLVLPADAGSGALVQLVADAKPGKAAQALREAPAVANSPLLRIPASPAVAACRARCV